MLYRIAVFLRYAPARHYCRWKATDSFNIDVKLDDKKFVKFSAGKLAKLADGSCIAQSGQTAVMATVVCKPSSSFRGFLPLTVDYRQKAAAAGRIPTNFIRREVGQTEKEILTGRAIDRSIRPLFARSFAADTQVVCAQLALDGENDPDVLAINAASGALAFSDVPGWNGPIGAVRIALIDGRFVVNPTRSELNRNRPQTQRLAVSVAGSAAKDEVSAAGSSSIPLDLVVVANGRREVMMIEGDAHEVAPAQFKEALRHAVDACQPLIAAISEAQATHGRPKRPLSSVLFIPALPVGPTKSATASANDNAATAAAANLEKDSSKRLDEKLVEELETKFYEISAARFREVLGDATHNKFSRDEALRAVRDQAAAQIRSEIPSILNRLCDTPAQSASTDAPSTSAAVSLPSAHLNDILNSVMNTVVKRVYREQVFETGRRVDGRSLTEMRPITCEVGLYDPLHGSALFQRGQTQVMSTVAFDAPDSAMRLDPVTMLLSGASEKSFILHYEMPPFATNETGRAGLVGRRERGHGALAERSIRPLVAPPHLDGKLVPFTTRLTCEVLESNGSSSMASVCAGSLALFDAGVPIARHVAGVAMGLLIDRNRREQLASSSRSESVEPGSSDDAYRVLTDLVGIEDYFGEMDCKLAGTERGFTAVQMDLKVDGVPLPVLDRVLDEAHSAILRLVDILRGAIASPRDNATRENMPVCQSINVPMHLRAHVIGFGGVNLKRIQAQCGVSISAPLSADDSSTFEVFAPNRVAYEEAKAAIERLIEERENLEREVALEFGGVYEARIVEVRDYGVLVQLDPRLQPSLVHNSQLDVHRIVHPSALRLAVGQTITVKYFGRDPHTGQIRLSRKALFATSGTPTGSASAPAPAADKAPRQTTLLGAPLMANTGDDASRLEDYAFEREAPFQEPQAAESEATASSPSAASPSPPTAPAPAPATEAETEPETSANRVAPTASPTPTPTTAPATATAAAAAPPSELIFGKHYEVRIVEIRDTGVMVDLGAGRAPALVLNGQLGMYRVNHASEVGLQVGQRIRVKYFGNDPQTGVVRLSRKAALAEPHAPAVNLSAAANTASSTRSSPTPPTLPPTSSKRSATKLGDNSWRNGT